MEAARLTGPARNLVEFARGLSAEAAPAREAEVSIVTFLRGEAVENAFVAAARSAGLRVDVIRERFRFDPKVLPQLRSIIDAREPHILQTHNSKSHFLVRLGGLARSRPWIAFHHGHTATDFKDRLYNQFDRFSLRQATRVVSVCAFFIQKLRRFGVAADRIEVLHNPAKPLHRPDPQALETLRAQWKVPPEAAVILSLGRLSAEKGHRDLIEAACLLRRSRPDLVFRLFVVGDGPERKTLQQRCATLGVEDVVILTGYQSDPEPYYFLADVFALPSRSEGSPNALLDAMAAGIPVVAASVGGVPEIVTHNESALLAPSRDPRAMAAGLAGLLSDRALAKRLAAAALKNLEARHRPETYRRALLNLYDRVLQTVGSPARR